MKNIFKLKNVQTVTKSSKKDIIHLMFKNEKKKETEKSIKIIYFVLHIRYFFLINFMHKKQNT